MVVRRRKKKNRLRGQRSHGKGNTKNKRGAGCRGGRGRAGSHKHKFSKYYSAFGVKRKLKPKEKGETINLDGLSERLDGWIEEKKVERKEGFIVIDGSRAPIDKILSTGSIKKKILVKNLAVSKKAKEKVEKVGGKVVEKEGKKEKVGKKEVGEKGKKEEGRKREGEKKEKVEVEEKAEKKGRGEKPE